MTLFDMVIGANLSRWIQPPGIRDDNQWEGGRNRKKEEEEENPTILWAVTLDDGRKAVLIEGTRLFVGRSMTDMEIFDGMTRIAKALLNLNINDFAEVKKRLPVLILTAITEAEEVEHALGNPPRLCTLPENDQTLQVTLPFRARAAS